MSTFTTSGWNRANIRTKLRNVVGMPSQDQLSDDSANAYINNYGTYQLPHELKMQIQNNFLDFKTTPGVNTYQFPGSYLTDGPGAYADGFPLIFYEDPDIFYQDWPQQYNVDAIAAGDGVQNQFAGNTQGFPIIIGTFFITDGFQVVQDTGLPQVIGVTIATGNGGTSYSGVLGAIPVEMGTFTAIGGIGAASPESFADNGDGTLTGSQGGTGTIDYTTGAWTLSFNSEVANSLLIQSTYNVVGLGVLAGDGSGTLNYATGAFSVTFDSAPASTLTVYSKYIAYTGNRPQGVLFFQNQFQLMPVPDQVYAIRMQGFVLPIQLVNDTDIPAQPEWGPLYAYGAALEVFADRGDVENYDRYYPILKKFENVALSRTIQQYTPEQGVPRF